MAATVGTTQPDSQNSGDGVMTDDVKPILDSLNGRVLSSSSSLAPQHNKDLAMLQLRTVAAEDLNINEAGGIEKLYGLEERILSPMALPSSENVEKPDVVKAKKKETEEEEELKMLCENSNNQKKCRSIGESKLSSATTKVYKNFRTTKAQRIVKKPAAPTTVPSRQPSPTFHHYYPRSTLSPERLREIDVEDFYRNYNPVEGVMTAIVLGGFFAFVCLLVIYKTKCKPMWKNRRKRLTNTPATQSVNDTENSYQMAPTFPAAVSANAAGSRTAVLAEEEEGLEDEDLQDEFECIPLQSVFTSGNVDVEDDCDIFFLDEDGNYVFPVSSPNMGGSCSCSLSADTSMANALRRQSQASAISAAYTVKSLPGAYLYIPLLDGRSLSLSSIRRSLSDPEIHFSPPFGQPIILTVNPSIDANGSFFGNSFHGLHLPRPRPLRGNPKLQQRSHSIQPEGQHISGGRELGINNVSMDNDVIAIQVIQPTPNVSPTCSLRSFNGDSTSPEAAESSLIIPLLNHPLSPSSSLKRRSVSISKADRRVSFSEDSVDQEDCSGGSGEDDRKRSRSDVFSPRHSPHGKIPFMNYLQVPGQQPMPFMMPQLTLETHLAQMSPQARKRRSTRLMKAGSFCSINSEGDGDIFGPTGELLTAEVTSDYRKQTNEKNAGNSNCDKDVANARLVGEICSTPTSNPKSSLDPLSEYTEFFDDCRSDISELFDNDEASARELRNQGTFSDHEGSIKSLSIDQEEVGFETTPSYYHSIEDDDKTAESSDAPTVVVKDLSDLQSKSASSHKSPPYNNPEYDEIMQHHIMLDDDNDDDDDEDDDEICASSSCSISMGSDDIHHLSHQITVPVTIEHPPPEMHYSSPEDNVEAAVPGSSSNASSAWAAQACLNCSPLSVGGPVLARQETVHTDSGLDTEEIAPASPVLATSSVKEEFVRMVLVRDIGIQVCGDSPNLNMTRKYHEINPSSATRHHCVRSLSAECPAERDQQGKITQATKETFPTEILF